MNRPAASLLALLLLAGSAGTAPRPAMAQTTGGPPHAWLFGTWTGGLFPVSGTLSAQMCLGQPTVIFTRDVVLRASLTEPTYTQRVVETARTGPRGTDFQFAPSVDATTVAGSTLLGVAAPKEAAGFGCENPDTLHVERLSDNEIRFPGCKDYPNPLVRCPAR